MPRVLRSTCLLAVIGIGLLLGACANLPSRTSAQATGPYTLLVVRRAWHVDVGWSADELKSPLNAVAAQFPGILYLLFGFGDRHYLLDHDHGSGGMLAALWPGGGLLLVTGLSNTPQQAFGADEVLEIGVSEEQLRDAQQFVWRSLAEKDGTVKPVQVGPYGGSFFYATPLKYSAAHTCNTWAAEVLRAAHLPVRSRGVVFAGQLWRQVQVLARRANAAPSGVLTPSESALPSP